MLDRAMTAVAGSVYDAIDDASDPIEAFLANNAHLGSGLGLVDGSVAFEPRLQYDYRYGRLYGIPFQAQKSRPIVFGISESTALLVGPDGATVIGQNPVIMTDSSWATFYTGENGALGAFNVLVDVYEPSQRINRPGHRRIEGGFARRDRSDEPTSKR